MSERKLILIAGNAGHGKDSFAYFLSEKYKEEGKTAMIFHYADILKIVCKEYYSWNGEKDAAGRTLLQTVGTDIGRKNDENLWVNILKSLIENVILDEKMSPPDRVIIADCRFENEISAWKDNPTKFDEVALVRVIRAGYENELLFSQKQHASENNIYSFVNKVDATIIAKDLGELNMYARKFAAKF